MVEFLKINDPDYQKSLKAGEPIQFKTLEDEKNFYIMLGWNACVTQLQEDAKNVIQPV